VAIYEYKCVVDGVFDVSRPIGTAPAAIGCAVCGIEARRVFSAPMLFRGSRALFAAIDHAEKSRDEPDVVTSIPSTGARRRTPMATMTPALRRLPRP
jgi:predicted nucleic acid-binding Zn ribbon protein